jgi:hypothetical protein
MLIIVDFEAIWVFIVIYLMFAPQRNKNWNANGAMTSQRPCMESLFDARLLLPQIVEHTDILIPVFICSGKSRAKSFSS